MKLKQINKYIQYLVFSPKSHLLRHLVIFVLIAGNHFNQLLFRSNYQPSSISTDNLIREIIFFLIILSSIYINIYVLIPSLLMRQGYLYYALSLIVLLSVPILYFYLELIPYEKNANVFAVILKSLSFYGYVFMWVVSTSVFIFVKKEIERQNESEAMAENYLRTSITRYKELVNPQLLSTVLRNTANHIDTNPKESSAALILLSKVLRYRLYDCTKEFVFMEAEVNYIRQYLSLVQTQKKDFIFYIATESFNGMRIRPLILSELVQKVTENASKLHLSIGRRNDGIEFEITSDNRLNTDTEDIKSRLDVFYPASYQIRFTPSSINLTLRC